MLDTNTWNHLTVYKLFVLRIIIKTIVIYKRLIVWNYICENY